MSKRRHNNFSIQPKNPTHISKAKIDVVITTAGRFDCLAKCIESVYREAQLIPINVYILDNASPADERQQNASLFVYRPEADPNKGIVEWRTKRLPQNMGFPIASNEGAKMGRSPIIMFLSDDVELHPGVIEKVVNDFNDTGIGIVGIKLLFPPTSTDRIRPAGMVQHVGLALDIRGTPIHPLVGWSASHPKTCKRNESYGWDAWAVTGACFSIRRELFNKAGGFDPIYGKGTFEDCDLCLKVRQLGSRIIVNTNATAYHYVGATVEKRRESFPIQNNLQIFQARWRATGLLVYDSWIYF